MLIEWLPSSGLIMNHSEWNQTSFPFLQPHVPLIFQERPLTKYSQLLKPSPGALFCTFAYSDPLTSPHSLAISVFLVFSAVVQLLVSVWTLPTPFPQLLGKWERIPHQPFFVAILILKHFFKNHHDNYHISNSSV